jgi:hypothetical protein
MHTQPHTACAAYNIGRTRHVRRTLEHDAAYSTDSCSQSFPRERLAAIDGFSKPSRREGNFAGIAAG